MYDFIIDLVILPNYLRYLYQSSGAESLLPPPTTPTTVLPTIRAVVGSKVVTHTLFVML